MYAVRTPSTLALPRICALAWVLAVCAPPAVVHFGGPPHDRVEMRSLEAPAIPARSAATRPSERPPICDGTRGERETGERETGERRTDTRRDPFVAPAHR